MPGKWKNFVKRKRRSRKEHLDLEGKVTEAGGRGGFGLEVPFDDEDEIPSQSGHLGIYGDRRSISSETSIRRVRLFHNTPSPKPPSRSLMSQKSTTSSYTGGRVRRSSFGNRSVNSSQGRLPRPAVHIVCAIGENLARETCVASLDAGTPVSLQVTKQGNGQTYAETMAYLQMLRPDEILLNEGRRHSHLARKVLQLFSRNSASHQNLEHRNKQKEDASTTGACETSTVVKFISRSCFDQTKGAELLRRVARDETYDPFVVEEYILLSSAHAVLNYTQQSLGATLSRNCLDLIINSGGSNRMSIDRSTLFQLELLANSKSGKTRNSLIASINCTKTTIGSRLLRTTIMAPPCRLDTINSRLDLVDSFLTDEDFFYTVLEHLKRLPDVDKMLTNVAIIPRKILNKQGKAGDAPVVTERMASKGITALVCIKTTLAALPSFVTALSDQLSCMESKDVGGRESRGSHAVHDAMSAITDRSSLLIGLGGGVPSAVTPQRHHLLRAIIYAMKQPALAEVLKAVTDVFTESTTFSRNANAMRHQECFALRSAENGMMDILRKAFLANVDDIYKKADEYAEMHGIHVSVKQSTGRGYYLSVPIETASTLPQIFIQPAKSGQCINCTTEEVQSLNIRARDNVQDLLLMTHERISEVLDLARSKYDALASLSDAVALLDLCHSFADNVTLSKLPWVRPKVFGEPNDDQEDTADRARALSIRNGRYGIDVTNSCLMATVSTGEITPNDTFVTEPKNFTVISGVNGAGKSMYLKQIAIIVILAHCGSYVPAEEASIPIRNRLCARIGTSDDQENNMSSFMLEMKETAFICNQASAKSLVLLDELGRATSDDDGVAIAWAVSEFLLSKLAMTFFVTHYPQICQLSSIYPSVQNYHLEALLSDDDDGEIRYTYKVRPGACAVASGYGVEMTSSCGWPVEVSEEARTIESVVTGKLQQNGFCDIQSQHEVETSSVSALEVLKTLSQQLPGALQSESSISSLRSRLQRLRQSTVRPSAVLRSRIEALLLLHPEPGHPLSELGSTERQRNVSASALEETHYPWTTQGINEKAGRSSIAVTEADGHCNDMQIQDDDDSQTSLTSNTVSSQQSSTLSSYTQPEHDRGE